MRKKILNSFLLALLSLAVAQPEDDGVTIEDDNVVILANENSQETIHYQSPYADPNIFYFADHFDNIEEFLTKWIPSEAKKDDAADEIAKYDGEWSLELPLRKVLQNDLGLVLKSKAKHAAISSRLNRPFTFTDKPLFVQYEVLMQEGQECGGAYLKLLSSGKETADLKQFQDKTPYTIMFGPDKCGNDIKLHFIFRHVNPKNGTITEKHCKKSKDRLEEPFKDKQPHLYQLSLYPDNTFKIRVDNKIVNEGSLLTDMTPPVNPPKEIDDPNDHKPEDWDEREKIPDPTSQKPDDWDEDAPPQIPDSNANKPDGWLDEEDEMIPDPNAEKPVDWDAEMDGEYEAPLIPNPSCDGAVGCGTWKAPLVSNPDYKGKWRAPLLDNPNYQGKWAPRKISNPEFFEDLNPFRMTSIAAVGFELWSMSSDILFDNLVITHDEALANEWAEKTFNLKKQQLEKQAVTLWDRMMRYMNYKPGWWFAYFIYCLIPITIYIAFLLSRRGMDNDEIEESFVSKIKNLVNESPYVVAVVLVVVALPISIIVYFLCSSSKPPPQRSTKKTDTPVPDDEPYDETTGRKSVQKNTLDLNAELDSDPAEQEEEQDVETDPPMAEEKEEVTEGVHTKPNTNESIGARKRKPRKE